MECGLGIDTGGTYTDAVIYDFKSRRIISAAKSVTVKENLTLGITKALSQLPRELFAGLKLVSLSTTLATNACVEGKGGRAALVLIGCDGDIVGKHGPRYGLPPLAEIILVDGGHNQQGEVDAEPDWDGLRQKISACRERTDAFAIVELWGTRNPEYEQKAKRLIMDWTARPVVCGHELTVELNSLKRSASTLLNAQLIPLINDFLNAVRDGLKEMEIAAPLMIVRGDGSLMSEEFAREKPVETLLSGPAASVAGGMKLSGVRNCLIVDMGGTTSDMAIVKDGLVRLAHEGVKVGNWRTGTQSILINTVGLGGDSRIRYGEDQAIAIGPARVAPLSWLADRWPQTLAQIRAIHREKKRHIRPLCEFFYLVREIAADSFFTVEELQTITVLKNGPLSIAALSEAVGTSVFSIDTYIKRLETLGIIMRCGLTPTDIMHISGDFTGWNAEAALLGAEHTAYQMNIGTAELVAMVNRRIVAELYFHIVTLLLENRKDGILKDGMPDAFHDLVMMGLADAAAPSEPADVTAGAEAPALQCRFAANLTLVGIGAPVHIYLPAVAKALNTECVIPEHAPVANAIGAITGNVVAEETITVRPRYEVFGIAGYIGHSSDGRVEFEDYREALQWAETEAEKLARLKAEARGAREVSVTVASVSNAVQLDAFYADETEDDGNKLLLETKVTARAVGALGWHAGV